MRTLAFLQVLCFSCCLFANIPTNVQFYASFDNSLNADHSAGDGTARTVSGRSLPTISSATRQFFGNAADFVTKPNNRAVNYAVSGNINLQRGSLELWWKPYFGCETPDAERIFYVGADSTHCMYFEKAWGGGNGGYMRMRYVNGASDKILGGYVSSYDTGRWQHIVLNWDNLTGKLEVFINGYLALSDTGFTALSSGQSGTYFTLSPTSGCMIDEVIIRNEPLILANPYTAPIAALNAATEQASQAAAIENTRKAQPSVQDARKKRIGIVMDLTGMIEDAMYSDEAGFKKYIYDMANYGVTDLALRAHGMGAYTYPTQFEQIEPVNTSYGPIINKFNHLQALIRYCHEVNIKAHLWFPMYDEGAYPPASLGGNPAFEVGSWIQTFVDNASPWAHYSIFARNNPDKLWKHRDGRLNAMCLSYAYPQVRQYRISQFQEAIDHGIDGIILDMTRWGWQDGRYLGSTGASIYDSKDNILMGYEQPIVDAWNAIPGNPNVFTLDNSDPVWVRFRAEKSITQLLRELKPVASSQGIEVGVNVFSAGNLNRNQLDVQTWISEELVDTVYPYQLDFSPALCWPSQWYEITNDFVQLAAGTSVKIIPCQFASWLSQDTLSVPIISSVLNAGAAGTLLYEAESVHSGHYDAIQTLKRMDLFGKTPDLNLDGKVNLVDFTLFAEQWLVRDCAAPYWCNGADMAITENYCLNKGTFLHHFDSLSSWDIDPVLNDYATGLTSPKNTDWFGNTIVLPNHGTGFISNGITFSSSGSYSPHIEFAVTGGDNVPETDFTIGCWVKLHLSQADGYNRQIISIQGPRTSERAEIDYGNYHAGAIRFQVNDGQSSNFSKEMYLSGSGPTWLYVALSFKAAQGSSADTFEFYVFNAQGQRLQNAVTVLSQPTSPLQSLDWNSLRIGGWYPTVNLSPIAIDEVSVQRYVSADQISLQAAEMAQQRALRAKCGTVNFADLKMFADHWLSGVQ